MDYLLNVLVALLFYLLGKRDTARLKEYIENLMPYETRLTDALSALEGKTIEGEGKIAIDRDADGNPLRIHILPLQEIRAGGISSEEEVHGSTIEVGPPPPPPPANLRGRARGRSHAQGILRQYMQPNE